MPDPNSYPKSDPMIELVITAVGPDRPGLVETLTGAVFEAGGNVADSRMVNLRGQFALLLLAEAADASTASAIELAAKEAASEAALHIAVVPHPHQDPPRADGLPLRLRASALDKPGIVHRISTLMHELGVNIEQLHTTLEPASYAAAPVFNLDMTVSVPRGVPVRQLRERVSALCDELNCDVVIEPG